MRRALTSSGLAVVNAPFREYVWYFLWKCDPNVSVRRIEASFWKRGNSLFGKPLAGVARPWLWFCVLVSTVCRLCQRFVGCSVARGFIFLVGFFEFVLLLLVLAFSGSGRGL